MSGKGTGRQHFGSYYFFFFLEPACSTDQKLLLPNNASITNRDQKQHHRYHHLAKDLLSPVYLTLSLWNFSDSILVKEIMIWKTKTINRYWRAPFPEWFPTGNHRKGKPAFNSQAHGSSRNTHNACFRKRHPSGFKGIPVFSESQNRRERDSDPLIKILRERLTQSHNTSTHQPSPAGPLLPCSSFY